MRRSKNLFKMPNDIFTKLTASEIRVLAVLYSIRSRSIYRGYKYIKVKQVQIARLSGFNSTQTISSAINKLCLYGYIKRIDRNYVDYKKLGTYTYTIPVLEKDYFFVDRQFLRYKLSSAQVRMYLFFCKTAVSRNKTSWNSFNDIAHALNIKRSSVIKTVQELVAIKLIRKLRVKKKDGSYSDNHYKVVSIQFFEIKKKRHRKSVFAPQSDVNSHYSIRANLSVPYTCILMDKNGFVKGNEKYFYFIFNRGSPKFCNSIISTHFNTFRRKNRIKLYLKYRCSLTIYHKKIL